MQIQRKRIWTRQPQYPVELDWNHPLADKLLEYSIATPAGILTARQQLSANLGTTPISEKSTSAGIGRFHDATSAASYEEASVPNLGQPSVWDNVSVFALGMFTGSKTGSDPTSFSTLRMLYGYRHTATEGIGFGQGSNQSLWFASSLASSRVASLKASVTANQPFSAFVWYDNSSNTFKGQFNNEAIVENTSTTTLSTSSASSPAMRVGYNGATSAPGSKVFIVGGVWKKELRVEERQALRDNPWQLFKPRKQVLYFGGGGGAQNLAGDAAAQSTASGAITLAVPIAGAAVAVATSDGALSVSIPLAAAATGEAAASGTLTVGPAVNLEGRAETVFLRPLSDKANAGWTSTEATLFEAINELTPNDASYIEGYGTNCSVNLPAMADPQISTGHVLSVRAWLPSGGGFLNAVLRQGTSNIAVLGLYPVPSTSPATYTMELSPAQADAITDYSDLNLSFATILGPVRVSWAELRIDKGATAKAAGALSLAVPLSAAAVAQALASAGLAHGVPLAGAAAGQAAASGSMSINVSLAGSAIAQAAADGGLTVTNANSLAGAAAAQASASANLTHAVPLTGAALTVSNASGSLTHIVPLNGAAAAASLATGGLDVTVNLDADALAQAMASAGLTVTAGTTMSGNALADAASSGTLTLRVNLDAAAVANAVAAGALAGTGLLTGTPGYKVDRTPRAWRVARPPRSWRVVA